ncbi:efflux RND transporter periplasmic adaptor subunit [Desulfobacter curvatus]|uniref:efflux RND transporter periplasmic adaptor subunit n=1 Tax=Desulfobacter curvatus TaxID=2290 RepID=UPI0003764397|nr:efflux RND transporter periplasmic adaptor subunit [Desulfobacter curvatus]
MENNLNKTVSHIDTPVHRSIKPIFTSVVGLVIVFGLLFVWKTSRSESSSHPAQPPVLVSASRIQSRSVPADIQAIGSLEAVQEVLLAPDTAGRITGIHFEAGQVVKEGTLLVQLYDAPEQADRVAAAAKAAFSHLQLSRSRELAPTGAEPRELLEQHQTEYEQAQAEVRQLDARIQQKSIHAPFAGQIGIRRINLGQYLHAGDPIATLTRLAPLYVNFTVPQQELAYLEPGTQVQVTADSSPDKVFEAHISSIEPRIDEETRNITVQALLPNADHELKSGMYVTARLQLPATTDAIVVPLTAIQTSAYGDSVVVVQELNGEGVGKVVTAPVKTGRRLGDNVLIEQGLKTGDLVITAGQLRIPPGAQVKVSASSLNNSDAAKSAPVLEGE